MIKYDSCLRCGSKDIKKMKVNSGVSLLGPEIKQHGIISQENIFPTEALVCNECGHVELFTSAYSK